MGRCWGRRQGCSRSWGVALGVGELPSELGSCRRSWGVAVEVAELPFSPGGSLREDRPENGRPGRPFTYKNERFKKKIIREDRSGRIAHILGRPGQIPPGILPQLQEQLPNSDYNLAACPSSAPTWPPTPAPPTPQAATPQLQHQPVDLPHQPPSVKQQHPNFNINLANYTGNPHTSRSNSPTSTRTNTNLATYTSNPPTSSSNIPTATPTQSPTLQPPMSGTTSATRPCKLAGATANLSLP